MGINTNYYGDYQIRNPYLTANSKAQKQNQAGILAYRNNQYAPLCKDGKDDGSIGFIQATNNLLKGGVKFFTGMFTDEKGDFSVKQTLKTVGMGVGIGLASTIPVVGPLVLPMLCLSGCLHGGKEVITGFSKAMSATTDAEAVQAWQGVGSGATEATLSGFGYKKLGGFDKGSKKAISDFERLESLWKSRKNTATPKPAAPKALIAETPAVTVETPAPRRANVEHPLVLVEKPIVKPVTTETPAIGMETPAPRRANVEHPLVLVEKRTVKPVTTETPAAVVETPAPKLIEQKTELSFSSPKEKLDFNMKKLKNSPDTYSFADLKNLTFDAINLNEFACVEDILAIVKNKINLQEWSSFEYMDLIKPSSDRPAATILRYFDKINKPEEAINFLKMLEQSVNEQVGCECGVKGPVTDIVKLLKKYKKPLSDKMTTALKENGYL